MKEFGLEKIIFVCTDSAEIFFSEPRSAGLNYNMPSVFTDSYCVCVGGGGVSNKQCLLTFFIIRNYRRLLATRQHGLICHTWYNKTIPMATRLSILAYCYGIT